MSCVVAIHRPIDIRRDYWVGGYEAIPQEDVDGLSHAVARRRKALHSHAPQAFSISYCLGQKQESVANLTEPAPLSRDPAAIVEPGPIDIPELLLKT